MNQIPPNQATSQRAYAQSVNPLLPPHARASLSLSAECLAARPCVVGSQNNSCISARHILCRVSHRTMSESLVCLPLVVLRSRSFSVIVSTRRLQFKRFIHIETTRLEHQGGKNVRGDMPGLVLRNNIRFLGNLPTVYMIIGTFMLLFWCVAMGFVFWAENYHRNSSFPFGNGTSYSIIDSIFMTTSAFTNSGLTSAPLFHSTTGAKIIIIFSMISYVPYVYEIVILCLYRRRLAQFIQQVFQTNETPRSTGGGNAFFFTPFFAAH
jgi:hypothetical protein